MEKQRIRIFATAALSLFLTIGNFSFSPLKVNAEGEIAASENNEALDDNERTAEKGNFPVDEEYIRADDNKSSNSASSQARMSNGTTSGTTGVDGKLTWKFENGTLTISGKGEMSFFNNPDDTREYIFGFPIDKTKPQWYDLKDQIQNIVIDEGVTTIGQYSFYRCAASSVSIPHSVKSISSDAFGNMLNLKEVVIPEGCESLQGSPFNRTPLTSLTVPASLKELRMFNFKSYTNGPGKWLGEPDVAPLTMDMIHITGDNPDLSIEDNILYGNHGKTIWYAEPDRTGTYHIKDGVTKLEQGSFYATKLSSVVIPSSVTEIGDMAFRMANNMKEFVIPDSVTKVGTQAIEEMDNLQKLTIGSGVRELGWGSFEYNKNLTDVVIKNGIENIGGDTFEYCDSLKDITLPESVTKIGSCAFSGCSSLTSVSLPKGLTEIGSKAFNGSGLKSVDIPKSVTSIESDSFPADCTLDFTDAEQQGKVSPSTEVTYDVQYMETDARSMLDQLNAFRTGDEAWYYDYSGNKQTVSGLDNLTIDARLQQTAMQRAAELALYVGHERPDGSSYLSAFPSEVEYYSGENVACGQRSVQEVMESWKETNQDYDGQGHRRNMLGRYYNAVGIGHVRVNNVDYWVQDFGYLPDPDNNVPVADDSMHTEKRVISNKLLVSLNMAENPATIELEKAGDTSVIPSVTTTNLYLEDLSGQGYSTFDRSVPVHPVISSWWTEDSSVASVEGGKVVGKKNGATNLVSYAFQRKITVPVQVGPKPTPVPTPASTPTAKPTPTPTLAPAAPTVKPTAVPTPNPTSEPASEPAAEPAATPASVSAEEKTVTMYRAYNPNSGEHFYTSSTKEFNHIVSLGWKNEGVGWIAPENSNTPVYRLYNANGGEHHYTTSTKEKNSLIAAGWKDEGIGWYSDDSKRTPLYRQYNPNAFANNHNYTTQTHERDVLISLGWKDEGIGWYGVRAQ